MLGVALLRSFSLVDGPPNLLGRGRHLDLFDAERAQGVDDRIHDRGCTAHRAELADALCPERIDLARRGLVGEGIEVRQIVRTRQAVILQRTRDELATFRIVMRVFQQRLPDRLRNAAGPTLQTAEG